MLYVIFLDKFTKEFVEFFKKNFSLSIESKFIIFGIKHQFDFYADKKDTFFINSYKDINKKTTGYEWAKKADLIIFSGIFGLEKLMLRFPKGVVDKSYFQFWGGDFYSLNKKSGLSIKKRLGVAYKKHIIKKVRGIITLIPGDYQELCKVSSPAGKHFVAPVCDNGDEIKLLDEYRKAVKPDDPVWILIGNSATETNQHIEILDYFSKYKNENIKIICPLSYGDEQYGAKVKAYGEKIFKEKFVALTHYMDKNEYFAIISNTKVAMFNNNRQQAMGNINIALAMGCKVFIRSDTAMWSKYNKEDYRIFDINRISVESFQELLDLPQEEQEHNYFQYLKTHDKEAQVTAWNQVFDSIKTLKEKK